MIADMHTHSENSHDSVCPVEEMLLAQKEKGTAIFAVTDHYECNLFGRYDIVTPMQKAYQTVKELNEKYGGTPLLLAGAEIGEAHLYPQAYARMRELLPYDVIIGSVHVVGDAIISRTDFSAMSEDAIVEFMDAYFDDVLKLADTIDIDVLAHLTLPLRYINGKYNIGFDVGVCKDKIQKILSKIIEKGIALEVNTSSLDALKELMPTADILKKYHDMGGYLITLGSDAHCAKNASLHFEEALETIEEIGFKSIYYYKSRKPCEIGVKSFF